MSIHAGRKFLSHPEEFNNFLLFFIQCVQHTMALIVHYTVLDTNNIVFCKISFSLLNCQEYVLWFLKRKTLGLATVLNVGTVFLWYNSNSSIWLSFGTNNIRLPQGHIEFIDIVKNFVLVHKNKRSWFEREMP